MFLTPFRSLPRRFRDPLLRIAPLVLLPLLLASCAAPVRMDDGRNGRHGENADAAKGRTGADADAPFRHESGAGAEPTEERSEPFKYQYADADMAVLPSARPAFFGFRFDDRRRGAEPAPPERPRENPALRPSFRELRQARATAYAEADMTRRGGNTYVRYDGSSSNPNQVKFAAAPGALGLRITASPRLNAVENTPTALVLVVYHLSDRSALDVLAATETGMRRLLRGELFDASVKSARQLFIQPGMTAELALERPEDGRYVAVVAGYNRPDARTGLHVAPYGVGEYKKKGETAFHRTVSMFMPLPMNLGVSLGETMMTVSETASIHHNLRDSTRLQRAQPHYFEEPQILLKLN